MRHALLWAVPALGACLLAPACVNPKDDYDQYLARTAAQRATASESDGGAIDATPPDAGFTGQYVMSCVSSVTNDSIADAFTFVANVQYTPSPGGGGTLVFSDAPLQVGATSTSQTVGPFSMPPPTPVGADGRASIDFGASTVPAAADPLGSDVVFTDSKLEFVISAEDGGLKICAGEGGATTAPVASALDPKANPCVFKLATPSFPTFVQSDYTCL